MITTGVCVSITTPFSISFSTTRAHCLATVPHPCKGVDFPQKEPETKGGEPNVFYMESQQWTFISVFLVQDSKTPIQGAYISRCKFQEQSRDLTLQELKGAYPEARLSPMEEMQAWIEKSSEFTARGKKFK